MTKTGLEFGISVILICLIFGICDLEFQSFQYSTIADNLTVGLNTKSSQRLLFTLTINGAIIEADY